MEYHVQILKLNPCPPINLSFIYMMCIFQHSVSMLVHALLVWVFICLQISLCLCSWTMQMHVYCKSCEIHYVVTGLGVGLGAAAPEIPAAAAET